MKFRMVMLAAAAAAFLAPPLLAHEPAAPAVAADALPEPARDAAAVVDAFHAALADGDGDAAAAMLAEDALIYEGGGAERSRDEYAAHHLAADMAFAKAVPRKMTGRTGTAAGDMAWIASEARVTGSYRDRAIDSISTESMVLLRGGGGWKIVHIHWSSTGAK